SMMIFNENKSLLHICGRPVCVFGTFLPSEESFSAMLQHSRTLLFRICSTCRVKDQRKQLIVPFPFSD
uniref:Uncharacterized protein n=1 Tax=Parascaris univalens TaxID=6257 RepID=A0A914ZZ08_PARUN